MVCDIFYMHQISSAYAGMCAYDHTCGGMGFDTHVNASNEEDCKPQPLLQPKSA